MSERERMSATLQATGLAAGHGARVLFSGSTSSWRPVTSSGWWAPTGRQVTLLRLLAGEAVPRPAASR
jgi:hypothetical protein